MENMGGGVRGCKRQAQRGFSLALTVWRDNILISLGKRLALMSNAKEMKTEDVLRAELEVFKAEHRDLDEAIHALEESGRADQLRLRRLKKQKLALKDKIARIEDKLFPDIIA